VEPNVEELPERLAKHANLSKADFEEAVDAADIVLLLVDHHQFKEADRALLEQKVVIDTKGIWR
jgi:UDP-N-acetyl-D-mannosaminuronic acid dehydrogenase